MTADHALLAVGVVTALICLALTVVKLRDLARHRRDSLRRVLWVTIAMGTFAVVLQPLSTRVDQLVGLLDVCRLVGNVLAMAIVAAGHSFLLQTLDPGVVTRRRVRRQYLVMGVCGVALIITYALTPAPYRIDDPFVRSGEYYASVHPPPVPYLAVYLSYMLWSLPQVGLLCARYAKVSRRSTVRVALRMIAAGCFLNVVNVGLKIANLLLRDQPVASSTLYRLTFLTYAAAAMLMVAGLTILTWGRSLRLDQLVEHLQAWRACRRLRPLWLMVSGAVPQVALGDWAGPHGRVGGLSRARMRLIRMTTEILDGYAVLCPWTSRQVAAEAREAATRLGLTGDRLEAAVEATVVTGAVAAATGDGEQGDGSVVLPAAEVTGAADAGAEVAWLIQVAAELSRPPVAAGRARPG